MQTVEQPEIVEAFLLVEQPRQRLGHWTKALAALDAPGAPPAIAIIAYYDPTCDQALIDLQFERRKADMRFVADVAILAEVGMVQPAELSEGERARFLADRLTRCTIRIVSTGGTVSALTELVRRIRDQRYGKPTSQPPPIPASATARSVSPRGDTEDPVMLVQAKGTQDKLERLKTNDLMAEKQRAKEALVRADPLGDGPEPPPPPRREDTTPRNDATAPLTRADRHRTVPMPFELSQRLTLESSKMFNLNDLPKPPATNPRASAPLLPGTVTPTTPTAALTPTQTPTPTPMTPTAPRTKAVTVEARKSRPNMERGAFTPVKGTEPYLPTELGANGPDVIHARYLRGGRWVPVRVGALSLKGAALLAGALPRVDDRVDVALSFGSFRAIVRGVVQKVSTTREASATGMATFTIQFELNDGTKRQLTNLLVAARDAKITIKPPPPRSTRRFPVEWQVALGTIRGAVKATALDLSTHGMFVQPAMPLEVNTALTFSVVLDDGSAPIAGRARVVRQIKEPEAKACGLIPGYGLMIVSMGEADRMRWLGFLARIERRADKRVLIGADASRLAELQAGLASLGYAVTGGTDPSALIQLASSDARPADAVLIDANWLQNEASASLLESMFSARDVPCVTMQGEVRRARQAIDRLLEVVV